MNDPFGLITRSLGLEAGTWNGDPRDVNSPLDEFTENPEMVGPVDEPLWSMVYTKFPLGCVTTAYGYVPVCKVPSAVSNPVALSILKLDTVLEP